MLPLAGTAATSPASAAMLPQTRSGKDPTDCPLPRPVPQPGQFALDAPVSQRGFSLAQLLHQRKQPGKV